MNNPPTVNVDLRTSFPTVRDQGIRPLCLAFSASDVNSNVNSIIDCLSVEYLAYYAYRYEGHSNYESGLTVPSVTRALELNGQPPEIEHTYVLDGKKPKNPIGSYSNLYHCNHDVKNKTFKDILDLLQQGVPIILAIQLSSSFFNPKYPFVITNDNDHNGMHAVIAVGYGELECGSKCILIRNSWGVGWGDAGYSWLTEEYLNNRLAISLTLSK